MKDDIYEIKNKLDSIDLNVLHNIYLFRCLTLRQIFDNFYINKIQNYNKFKDGKIREFRNLGLIEEVHFGVDSTALFLTKIGIDVVRDSFDLPINLIDYDKKKIKRGYYRASELKMLPRLIPHQVYLNQFVIDFKNIFRYKGYNMFLKHYDEKYVSQYVNIRPDGLLRLLDIDFFLEMDMNTESKAQLLEKWKHYRSFLTTNEYKHSEKKIVVLFIIENTKNIENRRNVVKMSASEILLDVVDSNFDIIVGTKEELLKTIFNIVIPTLLQTNYRVENLKNIIAKKHNFMIADGTNLKNKLNNAEYSYYIRKVDLNNNVVLEKGRIQEFLLDYYIEDSFSVINKIAYLQNYSSSFKYYFKRDISYIVICDDLLEMYKTLKLFDIHLEENVYYTTVKRLNNHSWEKALCQFDSLGRIFCFKDTSLNSRLYIS